MEKMESSEVPRYCVWRVKSTRKGKRGGLAYEVSDLRDVLESLFLPPALSICIVMLSIVGVVLTVFVLLPAAHHELLNLLGLVLRRQRCISLDLHDFLPQQPLPLLLRRLGLIASVLGVAILIAPFVRTLHRNDSKSNERWSFFEILFIA